MNKGSRPIQFNIGALLVLVTVAALATSIYLALVPPTQRVLVATEPIDLGDAVSDSNVRIEKWPIEQAPEYYLSPDSDSKGKILTTRVRKGQVIFEDDLRTAEEYSKRFVLPKGFTVVKVEIVRDPHDLHGLMLEPGDRVDVLVQDGNGSRELLFKSVRVFNIGVGSERLSTAGLLLSNTDALKIEEPNSQGKIRISPK